jgi:hypothetical protein
LLHPPEASAKPVRVRRPDPPHPGLSIRSPRVEAIRRGQLIGVNLEVSCFDIDYHEVLRWTVRNAGADLTLEDLLSPTA